MHNALSRTHMPTLLASNVFTFVSVCMCTSQNRESRLAVSHALLSLSAVLVPDETLQDTPAEVAAGQPIFTARQVHSLLYLCTHGILGVCPLPFSNTHPTHTHTHTYTYIHTYTHIHIHTTCTEVFKECTRRVYLAHTQYSHAFLSLSILTPSFRCLFSRLPFVVYSSLCLLVLFRPH